MAMTSLFSLDRVWTLKGTPESSLRLKLPASTSFLTVRGATYVSSTLRRRGRLPIRSQCRGRGVVLYHVSEELGIVQYILRPSKNEQDSKRARTGFVPR